MTPQTLKEAMSLIPEPVTSLKPPHWEYWRWELWHHVVDGDDPYGFMGWPCVYHTMLQNHWFNTVAIEATQMVDSVGLYPASINDSSPFYPKDYWIKGLENSANLAKQLYHLWRWEQASGMRIADMKSIHEFGGGYGAMALMAHRMGFDGKYVICDLPEFSLLQRFFLEEMGVDNVRWQRKPRGAFDFAAACYSLSEVDEKAREGYENNLHADNYLFLYSDRFVDYDNVKYFDEFMAKRADLTWNHTWISHMPPTSLYAFGFKWTT